MARSAIIERNTKETNISVSLNIDGTGKSEINTGIGFFNHMMEGFAKHGFFDLKCNVKGDLSPFRFQFPLRRFRQDLRPQPLPFR